MKEIIILGKRYAITASGFVRGIDQCPRCDAEGLVFVHLRYGDYYHDACGLHIGGPPEAERLVREKEASCSKATK